MLCFECKRSVKVLERDIVLPAEPRRSPDTQTDSQQCSNETAFARLKLHRDTGVTSNTVVTGDTATAADVVEQRAQHSTTKHKPLTSYSSMLSASEQDSLMFMPSARNPGNDWHDQRQPFAFRIHAHGSTSSQGLVSS